MSDNGMPTIEEIELAELQRIRDENYSDLLDQMQEAWGDSSTIGRSEVNAFLESRIVHKPTTRLREELQSLSASVHQPDVQAADVLNKVIKAIKSQDARTLESLLPTLESLAASPVQPEKSVDEIAHEDSYWDDPLRGTNKC